MIVVVYTGMTASFGRVPAPWSWAANLLLVMQFPLGHSFLLSKTGRRIISLFAKNAHAATLQTTIFATLASVQLSLLFLFWTPSGIVWWVAEGEMKWVLTALYACSWGLLMKASYDAGAEVQSGALGWMSLLQKIKPNYPDMPTTGLFFDYSPTNLSVIRADIVDRPRLDPRPAGVVHHSNSLLRVGPKVEGTSISGPFWCRVRTLSRPDALYAAAYSGHKERLTVSSLFDLM